MIETFDTFLVRAILAALGVALAAAPLGCFVVWRRLAYFGDATAHAGILGVALALAFSLPIVLGTLITALAMAFAFHAFTGRGHGSDTALGVLAHGALAAGIVMVSLSSGPRIDYMAFLFGDILTVGWGDIALIWAGGALIVGAIWWRWSRLLTSTLSPGLAHAAGIDPRREDLILTIALALTVAIAIKVVGVLLVASLLIIPAATARAISHTPEQMAFFAMGVGALAALGGIWASWTFDTPTGPSIVCAAVTLFAITLPFGESSRRG